jgi:hypothetical protein
VSSVGAGVPSASSDSSSLLLEGVSLFTSSSENSDGECDDADSFASGGPGGDGWSSSDVKTSDGSGGLVVGAGSGSGGGLLSFGGSGAESITAGGGGGGGTLSEAYINS